MKQKIRSLFLFVGIISFCIVGSTFAFSNPTHFVDSQWNLLDRTNGYDSIEVDITPEVEESTTTDGYYFANNVYFTNYTGNNFGGAYAGMQTNGYDGTRFIGKMAIFSVWDVSSGIAESGGSGTSFGGEGSGYSVRLPYAWQVGITYNLKIYIDQDASGGNRLWAASLTNQSTGVVTRIGRVYVPVDRGKIYGPVTFHERYMGPVATCADIKKSQVRFSNMTANNGASKASSWSHYAIAKIPECPGLAWLLDSANGYESGVGTTKPAPAVTVAPSPAPTTHPPSIRTPVVAPKPTPTPTPVVAPEPTISNTPTTTVPATHISTQLVAPKKRALLLSLLALGGLTGAGSALFTRAYLRKRKINAYFKKHFPFDPDKR